MSDDSRDTGPVEGLLRVNAGLRQELAERDRAEAALRETVAMYRQLVDGQPDLLCRFLPDTTLTFVNTAYARFFARAPEALIGCRLVDFLSVDEQAQLLSHLTAITPAVPARQCEHPTARADGALRWLRWHGFGSFDPGGNVRGFQALGVDITDLRQTEARLQSIDRALGLRRSCQRLLIDAPDETALADGLCRLIVTAGGYRMAWVGLAQQDEERTVRPLGHAGYEAGYLESVTVTWADIASGQGPTGTAVRTGRPVVAQNLLREPYSALWRTEALKRGYGSSIALPLRSEGDALGALTICAHAADAFASEEVALLEELADELVFGLSALRARRERQRAELALRNNEERFRDLVDSSSDWIWEVDADARYTFVAERVSETLHALCYLDLDQFKVVKDTAGHAAGDELLREIKGVLAGMFRERDTLGRIGGDEFGLLLDNCPLDRAQAIAQGIVDSVRDHRFLWAGRNRVHVYQREDSETTQRHGEILGAAGLRDTLEKGLFRLHYQPIVSLHAPGRQPVRHEALLRGVATAQRAERAELVLPATFIPAAERYGLMNGIDRWVIQAAFGEYAAGIGQTGVPLVLNLSANSLSDDTLLDYIERQFLASAFRPQQVCFEITETAAIQNLRRARELIAVLRRHGCQFALDDFGSRLSSFHYLKTLRASLERLQRGGILAKSSLGGRIIEDWLFQDFLAGLRIDQLD